MLFYCQFLSNFQGAAALIQMRSLSYIVIRNMEEDHKMKQVLIITSSIDETTTYIEEYDCDTEHRVQAIPDRI